MSYKGLGKGYGTVGLHLGTIRCVGAQMPERVILKGGQKTDKAKVLEAAFRGRARILYCQESLTGVAE